MLLRLFQLLMQQKEIIVHRQFHLDPKLTQVVRLLERSFGR
jgi:hypothetical protein